MQENNYEYLLKQLKYTGFKDSLYQDLKTQMESGATQFALSYQTKLGQDEVKASLQFKKSGESDMYFFNNYQLEVNRGNNTEALKQTFYISNKEDNVTLKEAYNLLEGRAVHKEFTTKEGEKYNAWVQLDFKQTDDNGNYQRKTFHQNYGYDLAEILAKHPIKELRDEQDKKMLMQSLERGNRQSITYMVGNDERKMFIEAVPQFKSLNVYDMSMQRIKPDQLNQANSQSQTEEKNKKQDQKQGPADDEPDGKNKAGKKTKKRAGIS
jgi:hypothetical protein